MTVNKNIKEVKKMTIEALSHRLELLLGDVRFRSDFDRAIESPEQLIAIGKHNIGQWEKIEAMGQEHCERIQNIISNMLASIIQEEAMGHYGNTDMSSIRQVLCGWFNRPEDREFEDRLREAGKRALVGLDLSEEYYILLEHICDKLPNMLMEYIGELVEPIHMLPRSEAQPIAMALVDMMKEVKSVNSIRS
jgi:hypothetical protein